LKAAVVSLNEIRFQPELATHLKRVWLGKVENYVSEWGELSEADLLEKRNEAGDRYDRKVAPSAIVHSLGLLEPVLHLAAKRVQWRLGDSQRNEAAKLFVAEMMTAWISATGEIPTCATFVKGRSKNESPFLATMIELNSIFRDSSIRLVTNLAEYAQEARRQCEEDHPELARLHKTGVSSTKRSPRFARNGCAAR
jgi:hypothetical protein